MKLPEIIVIAALVYMVWAYSIDLLFALVGFVAAKVHIKRSRKMLLSEAEYPALNVLVPCYNEEKSIARTIAGLRGVDYPRLSVTIINDGSSDSTLAVLQQELNLEPLYVEPKSHIPTQQIRDTYISACGRFMVVDKVNGGKADSLNVGINLADAELVCCVDADTIIKQDALKEIVKPFIRDARTVAVGGNVRIKNDSGDLPGFPARLRSPKKLISTFQVIEYIRSINIARNAMALLNGNLIISGAFGVFRGDILRDIGGYEKFSKGEDFELIARLHFHLLKKKQAYRIPQVYTADSFTDAPERYRELQSQRKRWQVGLVSTLRAHFWKFFRFPFHAITLFTLPYFVVFEILAPLVQVLTYLAIPVLAACSIIGTRYLLYLAAAILYSCVINILFLLMDFHLANYYRAGDKLDLVLTSLAEPFFYHQLNCWWKVVGTFSFLKNVFVRAAWRPPRNEEDFRSRLAASDTNMSGISTGGGPGLEKGLRFTADYKSLYKDRIIVLTLAGFFRVADIGDFERALNFLREKKRKKIILDMKDLKDLSSEALSVILQYAGIFDREKGGLVIFKPNRKIEDVLKISNAIKEVDIFKNFSDAIKKLKYG